MVASRRISVGVLGVLLAGLALGCRRKHATTTDASATTAPPEIARLGHADSGVDHHAAGPKKFHLVATAQGYDHAGAWSSVDLDGRIYVCRGGIAYEARDGGLSPLLPLAAFAPALLDENSPISGVLPPDDPIAHVGRDANGTLHLFGEHHGWTLAGGALSKPTNEHTVWEALAFRGGMISTEWERGIAWIGPDKAGRGDLRRRSAPKDREGYRYPTVARDGTLIAPLSGHPEVAIWRPNAPLDAGETVALRPRPPEGHPIVCRTVPAFDGNVYVCCDEVGGDPTSPTIHRFDGKGFVDAFVGLPGPCDATSIDREGTLYRAGRANRRDTDAPATVERCAPNGTCETIEFEPPPSRTDAHYFTAFDVVEDLRGEGWIGLGIQSGDHTPIRVTELYARAPDDVWAIDAGVIFHNGASRGDGSVVSLPSYTDARVLLQNEHPPRAWTQHCEVVFVQLASRADAGAGAAIDREKITAALGTFGPVNWHLVAGRLYRREVVGVVASRSPSTTEPKAMADAIERLVRAFTRDPINVPPVYCTLPVLSRLL